MVRCSKEEGHRSRMEKEQGSQVGVGEVALLLLQGVQGVLGEFLCLRVVPQSPREMVPRTRNGGQRGKASQVSRKSFRGDCQG